jgi:FMN phosphatase YigB (HAD superfamily)
MDDKLAAFREQKRAEPSFHTIFCDLGRVLVHFPHLHEHEPFYGKCAVSQEEIRQFVFEKGDYLDHECGRLGTQALFENVRKQLGYSGDFDAFCRDFGNIFTLNQEVFGYLFWQVKPANDVQLVMLSNLGELHYQYISYYWPGIFSNFRRVLLSFQEGMRKPDEEFFKLAVKRSGAYPPTTLFIDDMQVNCDAAEKCGIKTHLFDGIQGLRAKLAASGFSTSF